MHCIKVLLIASALIGGVAHAGDRVRVGKSQGSAWTFLPLDIGVEQGLFADERQELLGHLLRRKRPQARACASAQDNGADELCCQFGTTHHTVGRSMRTHSQAHALPEKKAS